MSWDAMMAAETLALYITRTNERALGVFVVSAEHVYRDRGGNPHKVCVSFVLEEFRGVWTLTKSGPPPIARRVTMIWPKECLWGWSARGAV